YFYNLIVVKINSRYCIIGFGVGWFFFNGNGFSVFVKLHYPVPLWVMDMIGIHNSTIRITILLEQFTKTRSVKNVISKNQGYFISSDKFCPYDKSLSQPIGLILSG